jgi:hypothetical protein
LVAEIGEINSAVADREITASVLMDSCSGIKGSWVDIKRLASRVSLYYYVATSFGGSHLDPINIAVIDDALT